MSVNIMLHSINDVKNFVNIVSNYDCEIDLLSSRYVVNAKSIMGIFSLDLSKPITLRIEDSDKTDEIIEKLSDFIIK